MTMLRARTGGFTLIEAIIVVIVLGILASMAWPKYIKVVQERYRREAKDTVHEMLAADQSYRLEHGRFSDELADLPMQDPNSRGPGYPLTYDVTGTVAAVFQGTATYSKVSPSATTQLQYTPGSPPTRCYCEQGWMVNDCPAGPCF